MTRVTLYFVVGDDEVRTFDYLDSSGASIPLTGYTATFSLAVGLVNLTVSGTVDEAHGKVTVQIPHTTTAFFVEETGWYECEVFSSGSNRTTIAGGPIVVITP